MFALQLRIQAGITCLLCRTLFAGLVVFVLWFFFLKKNLLRPEALVSWVYTSHIQASVEAVSVLLEAELCREDLLLE